jgi:Cys-rich four helix bundle protein (predicted Tat secretion target)
MRAASACITAGQLCLQHCLGLLGVGDVGLADCARAVSDMVAVSQATQALAAAGSPELKAQAGVAVAVLTRCEACCRKHAAHHDACRDCANRCAVALKEYRRLAA